MPGSGGASGRAPVGKELIQLQGGKVGLLESLDWSDIKAKVGTLPAANEGASLGRPAGQPGGAQARRARMEREVPVFAAGRGKGKRPVMKLASASSRRPRGYVIDYVTVSGYASDLVCGSGTTTYVSGWIDCDALELDGVME